VGDSLWVDNEGLLYVYREGKFEPHYFISLLFDKLLDINFKEVISVPYYENQSKLKNIKAYQFGEREMIVGEDGVLYIVANHKEKCLFVQARSSSNSFNARLNANLEYRAYKLAQIGYDTNLLKIARENMEKSYLDEMEKNKFNERLDRIVFLSQRKN